MRGETARRFYFATRRSVLKKITKASAVFILAASIAALTTAQVAPISRVNANNENNTVATATTSTEYIATTATVDINHDIENVAIINPNVTSSSPHLYISLVIACAILIIAAIAQGKQIR